jgi:putative ABC transport system permease protein
MRLPVLVGEAWSTARASRAYSILFGLIAFVVVFVVILLSAQAAAQRASVAATFERPELRTVSITDEQGLDVIPWSMADRATGVVGVEMAWVLGPAFDVSNGALPEAGRVSARMFAGEWRDGPLRILTGRAPVGESEALIDRASAARLGFDDSGGWTEGPHGEQWVVVGVYEPLHGKAPSTLLVPFRPTSAAQSLHFTAASLPRVEATTNVMTNLTEASGPGQLTVERSADAGDLQDAVSSAVNRYGAMIVLTVMATSLLSLAFLSILMVHSRRQEFGRRRALGATRGAIVALVVVQGGIVVALGSLAGSVAGVALAWLRFDTLMPWGVLVMLVVTTVCGSALAQIPSAVTAGLRDPVRVLRTP